MQVKYSAICLISTIGKKATAKFNEILKSDRFYVKKVEFICEVCYADGVRVPCKHNRDFVPDHLGENADLIKMLCSGNEEAMARDVMGIMDEELGPNCFTERSISQMMTFPRRVVYEPVRRMFLTVDPSGGTRVITSRSSKFCFILTCENPPTLLSFGSKDVVVTQDYDEWLLSHLRRVRAMPMFTNATMIVDAESGTGYTAGDVQLLIQRNFQNIICMNELGRKPGTYTSNNLKREAMEVTRALLDAGAIRIFDQLVCDDPKLMNELPKQLINFERLVRVTTSANLASTVEYTGKHHGPDDIAMTFLRNMYDQHRFLLSPMYKHLREY